MNRTFSNPEGDYPRYKADILLRHPDWDATSDLPEGWTEYFEPELPILEGLEYHKEIGTHVDADGVHWRDFVVEVQAEMIPEPPFGGCEEWTWDAETGWEPPTPCPSEHHIWHETNKDWVHINDWRAELGLEPLEV